METNNYESAKQTAYEIVYNEIARNAECCLKRGESFSDAHYMLTGFQRGKNFDNAHELTFWC